MNYNIGIKFKPFNLLRLKNLKSKKILDLKAQIHICRRSFQTSQFCRSDEIINRNILYRKFSATFKYLKEVILFNKVQVKIHGL